MSFQGQFKTRALDSIMLGGDVVPAARAGTTGNIAVLLYDATGLIVLARGTDVPTDATSGYAKGCIFVDTDVVTGSTGLYENVGTSSSCNFDAIGANTSLAAGGVDTAQLAADAVTGAKIEDDAIDSEHIAAGAVDNEHLATDIITGDEIADDAVSSEHLDDGLQDSLPTLALSAVDGTNGTAAVTIQVKDADGNDLAQVSKVHVWTDDTEFGAPTAITGLTAATGTVISSLTANADLLVVSDATGEIVLTANNAGAGTIYIMAEVNGKVYSLEVVITSI